MAWLDGNNIGPPDLGQAEVDRWIAGEPSTARAVSNFLNCAAAQKITGKLVVERPRRALPSRFLDEDDYLEQLRRCLTDDSIPLELRIAGALMRLYAPPLSRITELEGDQFLRDGANAYLTIDKNPVILPPRLAALIDRQLTRQPFASPFGHHETGGVPERFTGPPLETEHLRPAAGEVHVDVLRPVVLVDLVPAVHPDAQLGRTRRRSSSPRPDPTWTATPPRSSPSADWTRRASWARRGCNTAGPAARRRDTCRTTPGIRFR